VKKIVFKLASIKYAGDSVGNSVRLEITVGGDKLPYILDKTIKPGSTLQIDNQITQFETTADSLEEDIVVKVTEKDLIFDDVGNVSRKIKINLDSTQPQKFDFEVKVQERGTNFHKSTAVFLVTLEIKVFDRDHLKLQPYHSPNPNENYNQYDEAIIHAVDLWNQEFSAQDIPPTILLDPNLVKAMMYVESKMGYYNAGAYPGYPDLMQVADPKNAAIYALKNIYNPKKKRRATEYEVINGKEVPLEYKDIVIKKPEDSIYWGARWLYKKAQTNIKSGVHWRREWKDWKKAVYFYNDGGDKQYVEKVYRAYEKGVGENKLKLWEMGVIGLLLVVGGAFFIDQDKLDNIFVNPPPWSANAIDSRYQVAWHTDLANYAIKLNRNLYDPADCKMSIGSFNFFDVLGGCTYTVGSNSSDLWSVRLVDGHYYWHPKNAEAQVIAYKNAYGPYHVEFEKGSIGDLNADGKDDAVAVLKLINNTGDTQIRNIVVLVQGEDREMEQYASYIMKDREYVETIYISNGVISADVLVKACEDPECYPSVHDTYRFKL